MLSLDEAMELDFAGALPDMDVGFGFGFDFDFHTTTSGAAGGGCDFDTMKCCAAAGTGTAASPVGSSTKARGGVGDNEEERLRWLKRKISNRESARRSRARRRQRAEELERAAEELRAQRRALATKVDAAAARALAVRLDNARLGAEAGALRRRLGEAQRQAVLLLALARTRFARTAVGRISSEHAPLCRRSSPAARRGQR